MIATVAATPSEEAGLRDVLEQYQRFGLLVDDSPHAETRLARELYGTGSLPQWWRIARSRRCAEAWLRALGKAPAETPYLILVDRYLPESCSSIRGAANPEPWREEELESLLSDLPKSGRAEQRVRRFSSYPFPPYPQHGASSWEHRDTELALSVRRDLGAGSNLLRFAPSSWKAGLRQLAEEFARKQDKATKAATVVLLTGAGVSLAENRFSPGMPRTNWLIAEGLRRSLSLKGSNAEVRFAQPLGCWCEIKGPVAKERIDTSAQLGAVIKRLRDGGRLDAIENLSLASLVSERSNSDFFHEARELLRYLRKQLTLHDKSFPACHWFLAHLPWDLVVTTNFDRFHERAVMTAASRWRGDSGLPEPNLALGFTEEDIEARSSTKMRDRRSGERYQALLRKPYGSLDRPEVIAFSQEDVTNVAAGFDRSFRGLRPPVWLVVVGHSMRDSWIGRCLVSLSRPERGTGSGVVERVFWVVPEAESPLPTFDSEHPWQGLLREMQKGGDSVYLFGGYGHAFAHDLAEIYLDLGVSPGRKVYLRKSKK